MSQVICSFDRVTLDGDHLPRLDDVSVRIGRGITAVLGNSGAGKTSLLNLMVGFEKPGRGSVDISIDSEDDRLPLYWAPQDAGLWPHLTVQQHLDRVSAKAPMPTLQAFDLDHRAQARPHDLSQGERARLSVARALATRAAVLVMDEPLAHVDPQRIDTYWQHVIDHVHRTQASLVFATHSPRAVLTYAQRAIVIDAGRVLYEGAVDELYEKPPDELLARCLGHCNWLPPEAAQLWLGASNGRAYCYRPQQVTVVPDEAGEAVVQDSRFRGDVVEVTLRHAPSGEQRRFVQSPASPRVKTGDRVSVRILLLLLLALLAPACNRQDSSAFAVSAIKTWQFPAEGPTMPKPRNICVDNNDRVIVLDTAGRVLIFDQTGKVIRQWRMPTNEAGNPEGACVLRDGRIAVADTHYSRVVLFDQEGNVDSMFGENGPGEGQFQYPVSIVQDDEDFIYVCEYGGNDRVQKFTPAGRFVLQFGGNGTGPSMFQRASGMVCHKGRLYIADAINNRIQVFDRQGKFIEVLGASGDTPLALQYPYDLSLGRDGLLYVIEYGAGRVTRVGLDGKLHGRFGTSGIGRGQFRTPWGIGVDSKMRIRVADTGNHRIVELRL